MGGGGGGIKYCERYGSFCHILKTKSNSNFISSWTMERDLKQEKLEGFME